MIGITYGTESLFKIEYDLRFLAILAIVLLPFSLIGDGARFVGQYPKSYQVDFSRDLFFLKLVRRYK